MKFNRISTAKIQESVDIERLIASQYPDNYLGTVSYTHRTLPTN